MKRFLLFLLIFFFFFALNCAFADNIKFVQITDSHLSTNSEYSQRVLKSAIKDINSLSNISFVVFTGDNINEANPDNLRRFMEIISKLKVPYYIVIGNHDVFKTGKLSKAQYYEVIREKNLFYPHKSSNYKFKKGNFVFLIVDGAKEVIPGPNGFYKEATLAWVDKNLTKYSKNPVIIFQHFPLEYPPDAERIVKSHQTYKAEEYQKILDKHTNVLAVISGHLHLNGENMKNGVYYISSPSLLGVPNSYKIIDIITTKEFSPIIYTQLKDFTVEQ